MNQGAPSRATASMKITFAGAGDTEYLTEHDRNIPAGLIARKIDEGEILLAWEGDLPVGWLRFNYLWDSVPFMTLLFVEEPYRGRGHARALIEFWESEMRAQGKTRVLTSTMSNEQAQHMYRKLGYRDCGGMVLPQEPLEIILFKEIA